MSRIDEALRRAADERPGAVVTEDATPQPAPADSPAEAATLAREPFPEEIRERRAETVARRLKRRTEKPLETAGGPGDATAAAQPVTPGREPLSKRIDAGLAEKVVADNEMSQMSREQYRKLAAVLLDAQAERGLTVVMIASAVPGEGKTLTAVNLALTLSESYQRRVLLVDADLRKPTLHQLFQINAAAGLSEGLASTEEAKLVVRQVSARLSVLPAGRPTGDPMAALSSPRMRQLIKEAKETFDWVILDTPPLVLLPDGHLLSSMADGTLLVVRANSTPHALVKRAVDIIGRDGVTGVLLNRAAADQPSYGDHSHEYYLSAPKAQER